MAPIQSPWSKALVRVSPIGEISLYFRCSKMAVRNSETGKLKKKEKYVSHILSYSSFDRQIPLFKQIVDSTRRYLFCC